MTPASVPALIGHGRAGRAMLKALELARIEHPNLRIADPLHLPRNLKEAGEMIRSHTAQGDRVVALIANPHGLHAATLLALAEAGAQAALVEKPAAVSLEQVRQLRGLARTPVAVAHGYRQQWGVQKLRELLRGDRIFAIEGKYWQSSAAVTRGKGATGWKDDTELGGSYDVLLDLGTHYLDLCSFLLGSAEMRGEVWLGYANSSSEHRDTHVQLGLSSAAGARVTGSISKTVHGAGNELDIHVLTENHAYHWSFSDPDRLVIGEGASRRVVSRTEPMSASGLAPFHAAGWLDGYAEILARLIDGDVSRPFPTLTEHLDMLENLFTRIQIHKF